MSKSTVRAYVACLPNGQYARVTRRDGWTSQILQVDETDDLLKASICSSPSMFELAYGRITDAKQLRGMGITFLPVEVTREVVRVAEDSDG